MCIFLETGSIWMKLGIWIGGQERLSLLNFRHSCRSSPDLQALKLIFGEVYNASRIILVTSASSFFVREFRRF